MDTGGLLLFMFAFIVVGGVFIYCYHKLMDKAMTLNHEAWKHATHAQDDAWQRMNNERVVAGRTIENLVQWNAALTQQVAAQAQRSSCRDSAGEPKIIAESVMREDARAVEETHVLPKPGRGDARM